MSYKEVREPHTGKLLFRFDAERDTIEIQQRGMDLFIRVDKLKRREIRNPLDGNLLFLFDINRRLIELQKRGIRTIIDLRKLKQCINPSEAVCTMHL